MKQYYICKPDGTQEGPYPEAMIQACIAQGLYPPGTLVWCDGMAEWSPIETVFLSQEPRTSPPPMKKVQDKIKVLLSDWGTYLKSKRKNKGCIITGGLFPILIGFFVYNTYFHNTISIGREAQLNKLFPDRTPKRIREIKAQLKSASAYPNYDFEAKLLEYVTEDRSKYKDLITQLVYVGTNPDVQDIHGRTPLHIAIRNDQEEIAELLISAGSNINIKDNEGCRPINYAFNSPGLLKLLIDAGADVNVRDNEGKSLLSKATEGKCMELLLKAGADYHSMDDFTARQKEILLHAALSQKNLKIAKQLIEDGVDVNCFDYDYDHSRYLIEYDDYSSYSHNYTRPIHTAALSGADVDFLIDAGADVTVTRVLDITPLHWAATADNVKNINRLIDAGADVNCPDSHGKTPLHWAAEVCRPKNITRLIKLGADVEAKDREGNTPLHCAATTYTTLGNSTPEVKEERVKAISQLLKSGADVNARNEDGNTPLHCAAIKDTP